MVNPSCAVPVKYLYSDWMPRPAEHKNITHPRKVTNCKGAPEKDVMLRIAYLVSFQTDHLDMPISRSFTWKGMDTVLKPIQADGARKNGARSGIVSSAFTAWQSKSLKSEALDISIPEALLMNR